jgi:hypothetical protein
LACLLESGERLKVSMQSSMVARDHHGENRRHWPHPQYAATRQQEFMCRIGHGHPRT